MCVPWHIGDVHRGSWLMCELPNIPLCFVLFCYPTVSDNRHFTVIINFWSMMCRLCFYGIAIRLFLYNNYMVVLLIIQGFSLMCFLTLKLTVPRRCFKRSVSYNPVGTLWCQVIQFVEPWPELLETFSCSPDKLTLSIINYTC